MDLIGSDCGANKTSQELRNCRKGLIKRKAWYLIQLVLVDTCVQIIQFSVQYNLSSIHNLFQIIPFVLRKFSCIVNCVRHCAR